MTGLALGTAGWLSPAAAELVHFTAGEDLNGYAIPHAAGGIVDANLVLLPWRAAPFREIPGVAALGIRALGTRTMDVDQVAVRQAESLAKGDVDRVPDTVIQMGGAAPVPGFGVGDVEHRVNRRRASGLGRTAVVHDALQFLGIG